MLPVIAIIGRPNVGKSTLFNCLTRSRAALVADTAGLTRDRQYGEGQMIGRRFIAIDTGGLYGEDVPFHQAMRQQVQLAINEADAILFMVDAKSGLLPDDAEIANDLRGINKPLFVVVNKIDNQASSEACAEFYALGFANVHGIAAVHGHGVSLLMQQLFAQLALPKEEEPQEQAKPRIKIAIAGRPNVGKSTLVNRLLGEERVLVSEIAGTTRDSIYIPFDRYQDAYTLIDTAGVRRRGRIADRIEKFSIIKTLQAIADAHVVIFVVDALEGIVEQDLHLIGFIVEAGKGLVIAINKWDGLASDHKEHIKNELARRLPFLSYVRQLYISALHGTNVGNLLDFVKEAYQSATKSLPTAEVTAALQKACVGHQPPLVHGRRIKLRYAHLGAHNPPLFVIHGNQTPLLPKAYQRYLMNFFHTYFHLMGTPIRLEFKTSTNPYRHKKNVLTDKQRRHRQRLIKHERK